MVTLDTFVQEYGGEVIPDNVEISNFGYVTIKFSRNLVYPESLVKDYMPNYTETVIDLDMKAKQSKQFNSQDNKRRDLATEFDYQWIRDADLSLSIEDRVRIEVVMGDDSDTPQDSGFVYNITSLSEDQMDIQINFTNPDLYNKGSLTDQCNVYLNFSDFDPSMQNPEQVYATVRVNS